MNRRALPLKSFTHHSDGIYQQSLFDPIQTHGVYGLTEVTLPKVKQQLKEDGATRFRTVKVPKSDFRILCYRAPERPLK